MAPANAPAPEAGPPHTGMPPAATQSVSRDAELLEAFRTVTDWSDERVLHFAGCKRCTPICGYEEYDCDDSPGRYVSPPGRVVYVRTLPAECYRAGAGFMVHVRPCTC